MTFSPGRKGGVKRKGRTFPIVFRLPNRKFTRSLLTWKPVSANECSDKRRRDKKEAKCWVNVCWATPCNRCIKNWQCEVVWPLDSSDVSVSFFYLLYYALMFYGKECAALGPLIKTVRIENVRFFNITSWTINTYMYKCGLCYNFYFF